VEALREAISVRRKRSHTKKAHAAEDAEILTSHVRDVFFGGGGTWKPSEEMARVVAQYGFNFRAVTCALSEKKSLLTHVAQRLHHAYQRAIMKVLRRDGELWRLRHRLEREDLKSTPSEKDRGVLSSGDESQIRARRRGWRKNHEGSVKQHDKPDEKKDDDSLSSSSDSSSCSTSAHEKCSAPSSSKCASSSASNFSSPDSSATERENEDEQDEQHDGLDKEEHGDISSSSSYRSASEQQGEDEQEEQMRGATEHVADRLDAAVRPIG